MAKGKYGYHFRLYKKKEGPNYNKKQHPKLIVDENTNEFGFMGFTESKKRGHHGNIPLERNPKRKDSRPAYLRKELRYDLKTAFDRVLSNYRLTDKDADKVAEYLSKIKRK